MAKLILMSMLIAMVAIPTRAARDPDPMRGLRRALTQVLMFEVAYAFAVRFLWAKF
jgi:hypothetical protein